MASDQSFVEYVFEQARLTDELSYRKMFGEYAVYLRGKVVGLVCDNQFFVKPTAPGKALLGRWTEGLPYPGAKPYLRMGEELDDPDLLHRLLIVTAEALPLPKPRPARKAARKSAGRATPRTP